MFKTVQIEELGGAGAPGPWQLRIDYESQNMETSSGEPTKNGQVVESNPPR